MAPRLASSAIALFGIALWSAPAVAAIQEIIDAAGDGAGNGLNEPRVIATDAAGNVYLAGVQSDNAFEIAPGGVVTEIIDATGDGSGNTLNGPAGVAVDAAGNVFVAAVNTNNAFRIAPGGIVTEIIDATGDGAGNVLGGPRGIAVDGGGSVYVAGSGSDNAFEIEGVAAGPPVVPVLSRPGVAFLAAMVICGAWWLARRSAISTA